MFKGIREHFSVPNSNPKRTRFHPKRYYAVSPTGYFRIGIWEEVYSLLCKKWSKSTLDVSAEFKEISSPKTLRMATPAPMRSAKNPDWQYRDYQYDAIIKMLSKGGGIALLPTSAGKTAVMSGVIINSELDKIFIAVPNLMLLNQTVAELIDFGVEGVSAWSATNPLDTSARVVVASNSIIVSRFKEFQSIEDTYDMLIIDEVHKMGDNAKISTILYEAKIPHKFGLTGTLPEKPLDGWSAIGITGPVVAEETSKDLRDRGVITDVVVVSYIVEHPKKNYGEYVDEYNFLYKDVRRNRLARKIIGRFPDMNMLVLVDRISHGNTLTKVIEDSGKEVLFIRGDTPDEEREEIKARMEVETGIIVVAMSSIFSTGVSINNLHAVLFMSIGKSKVKIIQSIGRALRKHPSKKVALVFDISDNTKYSSRHYKKRRSIYTEAGIKVKETRIS